MVILIKYVIVESDLLIVSHAINENYKPPTQISSLVEIPLCWQEWLTRLSLYIAINLPISRQI